MSKAEDLPTRILLSGYLLSAAAPWLGKASRWLILDRGHWGRVAGFIAAFVVVFPLPGEALLFLNWQRYGGAPAGFDAESWFFTRR